MTGGASRTKGTEGRIAASTFFLYSRITVAVLTFIVYVAVHANRKSFSNVKALITEEWSPTSFRSSNNSNIVPRRQIELPSEIWTQRHLFPSSNDPACKAFLGLFNTIFMACYAVSQYFGGFLADRVNRRYLLCATMFGSSAVTVICFCLSEWLGVYSVAWYMVFWICNALCQGPAWPCVLAIMSNWFGKSNRGLILGLWSVNCSIGNILGALLVASVIDYGYEIGVLVAAIFQAVVAIITLFGLVDTPEEVGLKLSDFEKEEAKDDAVQDIEVPLQGKVVSPEHEEFTAKDELPVKQAKGVSFGEALCLPGVAIYALSYANMKMVAYAFFFWLPFYLSRKFHWSSGEANKLSVWYDVGGMFGSVIIGLISDRVSRSDLPDNKILNACLLFIVGYFIVGVMNLLSGAVAADLGRHPRLSSNKVAQSTVSGIMEGTGSAYAALGQLAIPLIEQSFGWSSVFWMLVVCISLTGLGVGRMVYSDFKEWRSAKTKSRAFNRK